MVIAIEGKRDMPIFVAAGLERGVRMRAATVVGFGF
jgi:hypothetical protein